MRASAQEASCGRGPRLPPEKFFTPLHELLAAVQGGARFAPTTGDHLRSGVKPPFTVPAAEPPTPVKGDLPRAAGAKPAERKDVSPPWEQPGGSEVRP